VEDENTPAAAALHFEEDLATQAACAAEDFSWDLGADAVDSAPDVHVDSGIKMVVQRNKIWWA
jgi:anti-sigma factor RsiW